jgi:hypothetical protein
MIRGPLLTTSGSTVSLIVAACVFLVGASNASSENQKEVGEHAARSHVGRLLLTSADLPGWRRKSEQPSDPAQCSYYHPDPQDSSGVDEIAQSFSQGQGYEQAVINNGAGVFASPARLRRVWADTVKDGFARCLGETVARSLSEPASRFRLVWARPIAVEGSTAYEAAWRMLIEGTGSNFGFDVYFDVTLQGHGMSFAQFGILTIEDPRPGLTRRLQRKLAQRLLRYG